MNVTTLENMVAVYGFGSVPTSGGRCELGSPIGRILSTKGTSLSVVHPLIEPILFNVYIS